MSKKLPEKTRDFVGLYETLKKYAGEDGSRLSDREFILEPTFRGKILELDLLHKLFRVYELKRRGSPWPDVDPRFPALREEFLDKWSESLEAAATDIRFLDAGVDFRELMAEAKPDSSKKTLRKGNEVDPPKRDRKKIRVDDEYPEEFDLEEHDAGAAVDLLVGYLEQFLVDQEGETLKPGFSEENKVRIGLAALEYFQNQGLDFNSISDRLEKLKPVYVPEHVSTGHSPKAKNGLFSLLVEARRAFIFGAPLASLAMCRAILELVIKEHYVHAYNGQTLEDWLRCAEKDYPTIKSLNLRTMKNVVNDILHNATIDPYADAKEQTLEIAGEEEIEKIDATVLNFFSALKELIEGAPDGGP